MKELIEIDEVKKIELDILKHLKKICDENNIKFFLGAGTLIGAVRHKGFIPWDDDIDVFMFRDDYNKLINIFNNTGKYKLLSLETSSDYYLPFMKLVDSTTKVNDDVLKPLNDLGIWVDIFPLDYYDEKLNIKKLQILESKNVVSQNIYFKKSTGNFFRTLIKRIFYILYHNKNPRNYAIKINNILNKQKIPTKECCIGFSLCFPKDKWPTEFFEQQELLEFEGELMPCPKQYREILTIRYGDFMKLPPENEQVNHHTLNATRR